MITKTSLKKTAWLLFVGFMMMNVVAFFHAYKFTHFASAQIVKTKNPEKLSVFNKIKTLVLGVNNPRPINKPMPQGFTKLILQSNKKIECWYLPKNDTAVANGTVILFHGYSGDKSTMVDKAEQFVLLNYNVLLVDFMGSGGSEGNQTTLGFKEAIQVKTAFDYIASKGEKNIYLFGTSMGAAAILDIFHK